MRILIISKEGDGCGLAHQLAREGHAVDLYIKDAKYARVLRGIVNRVESFRPVAAYADLVIADMVGFSNLSELFRRLGKPVIGFNEVMDVLELDRRRGMQTLQRLGLDVPAYQEFKSPKDAASLEWESPHGYVIKPSGNLESGSTYMCCDEELYEWALGTFKAEQELIVQECIDPATSIEVSTEGWWNGTEWLLPFNHTFEEKRFMNGDLGKMTGCQGNIVFPLRKPNRLVRDVLLPLTPLMLKSGYRGPIDVNCLVTREKAYALELTCRFGYDALEALMHGMNKPVGSFLFDLSHGIAKEIPMHGMDYLIAVRATIPPYPHADYSTTKYRNLPVCGLEDMNGVYLSDVYLEGDEYKAAASDGVLLKATANGRDIREAMRRCYARLEKIHTMDLQYRTDIGRRVDKDVTTLKEWGWL